MFLRKYALLKFLLWFSCSSKLFDVVCACCVLCFVFNFRMNVPEIKKKIEHLVSRVNG